MRVELSAAIAVANRGNRAERGQVDWRVYSPRGRVVASGSRFVALGVGGSVRLSVQLQLGRASQRAAGIYRLVTSFRSGHGIWWAPSQRFRQPY